METYDIVINTLLGYIIYNVFIKKEYSLKIPLLLYFILVLYFKGLKTRWSIFEPNAEREHIIRPLREYL